MIKVVLNNMPGSIVEREPAIQSADGHFDLNLSELLVDAEHSPVGMNQRPVVIYPDQRDLLPYFREMDLEIELKGIPRGERKQEEFSRMGRIIGRIHPADILLNTGFLVGFTYLLFSGYLARLVEDIPILK